jgi:hypothetical protein
VDKVTASHPECVEALSFHAQLMKHSGAAREDLAAVRVVLVVVATVTRTARCLRCSPLLAVRCVFPGVC